mgnify:CR=1 FL=1
MTELNNECHKIKIEALIILYEFFVEIDNLDEIILLVLLDNKQNFYTIFKINQFVFDNTDLRLKIEFIQCELERIDNGL